MCRSSIIHMMVFVSYHTKWGCSVSQDALDCVPVSCETGIYIIYHVYRCIVENAALGHRVHCTHASSQPWSKAKVLGSPFSSTVMLVVLLSLHSSWRWRTSNGWQMKSLLWHSCLSECRCVGLLDCALLRCSFLWTTCNHACTWNVKGVGETTSCKFTCTGWCDIAIGWSFVFLLLLLCGCNCCCI